MKKINSNKKFSKLNKSKFTHAFQGLAFAIKEEISLVVHIIIAVIVLIISSILHAKMQWSDWAIIVLVIGIVIAMELINTAIENLVDLVAFKFNINSKKIKDISAAATLIMSITAIVIGLLILIPKIAEYFQVPTN
ncbi:diacylglycerol kinase [Mycoplasmoides pirum]|uniref:diacylglycerol kinase n=1 Tax=Mycoplasmoides pirum TaxID=2122 RepID=UPI00047F92A0|nr:diacylglycerol kinase [Mycoplasmoides pirum]